ncbi:MAG: hypothetical protein LC808_22845 [Actinobacteria bacterium]|nr:hypothetical protein [Actinomycetota bacterium]
MRGQATRLSHRTYSRAKTETSGALDEHRTEARPRPSGRFAVDRDGLLRPDDPQHNVGPGHQASEG